MSLKKFLSEVEKVLKDDKVKTSIYLMHKINFVKNSHIQNNKEDGDIVDEFLSTVKVKGLSDLRANISNRVARYKEAIKTSDLKISEIASHKVKNGANIFVYENSQQIANALKTAKERGVNFSVHTIGSETSSGITEAHRILSDSRITMKNFSGVLINKALENSDILFFEPSAVDKSRILVTSELNAVLDAARKNNVLAYGLSSLFGSQKNSKANLEEANPKNIAGIITEAGIVKLKDY